MPSVFIKQSVFELQVQRVSGQKNRKVLFIEIAYVPSAASESFAPSLAALYVHSKGGKRPHVLYKQTEQTNLTKVYEGRIDRSTSSVPVSPRWQ